MRVSFLIQSFVNGKELKNKMGSISLSEGGIISKVMKEHGGIESKDKDLKVDREVSTSQTVESKAVEVSKGSQGYSKGNIGVLQELELGKKVEVLEGVGKVIEGRVVLLNSQATEEVVRTNSK